MFYSIHGLCPTVPFRSGGHGFLIRLWPSFKQAVSHSGLTQELVDRKIENDGRTWLDACGYDQIYVPGEPAGVLDARVTVLKWDGRWNSLSWEERLRLAGGPNARPLYVPGQALRVRWGEWGPEQIDVPGDSCGLNVDRRKSFRAPAGGVILCPHNVDTWNQVQLLLIVFCWFADYVASRETLHEVFDGA